MTDLRTQAIEVVAEAFAGVIHNAGGPDYWAGENAVEALERVGLTLVGRDDSPRIVVELKDDGRRVEATLWLNGCPVEGHGDSTGTLPTHALVAPLIRRFELERGF